MYIERLKRKNDHSYKVLVKYRGVIKTKTLKRRIDAQQWGQEAERLLRGQGRIGVTFAQLAVEWLEHHSKPKNCLSAYWNNKAKVTVINNTLGYKDVQNISFHDIELLIKELSSIGKKSLSTINAYVKVVRAICNYGIRRGDLIRNPVRRENLYKVPERPYIIWQKEEAERFIAFADQKYSDKDQHIALAYRLALNTGMRLGEIVALKWDCVYLGVNPSIGVKRSFCDRTRQLQETTKSKKVRYIGVNDALLPGLKRAHDNRFPDCEYVVGSQKGCRLDARNFRKRYFEQDIQEAGVTKIRIHDLRHTFASLYVMNGGSLFDLQKILGHCDTQMTSKYAHHSKDYLLDKAKVVVLGRTENVISVNFNQSASNAV